MAAQDVTQFHWWNFRPAWGRSSVQLQGIPTRFVHGLKCLVRCWPTPSNKESSTPPGTRLFVCGRIKNLMIIGGKNFYPQDIEQSVQEASEHIRPGHVVACSNAAVTGEERMAKSDPAHKTHEIQTRQNIICWFSMV